jgi:hypothetical protein
MFSTVLNTMAKKKKKREKKEESKQSRYTSWWRLGREKI